MSDTNLDNVPKAKASRTKLLVIISAAALVLVGGITTAVVASNAYAAETEELCVAALEVGKTSREASELDVSHAANTLIRLEKSEPFAKDRGDYAHYLKRPAVEAVEAVPATDGNPAVKAVAARPSGAELVQAVKDDQATVEKIDVPAECDDRETAEAIHAGAKKLDAASAELVQSTDELSADFKTFSEEVAAQIKAEEKAAAEKKAAEEAAAAAEAERIAAEQAAAEQAAWEAQQSYNQPQDTGYYNGGGVGGGGYNPGGGGGSTGGGGGGGTNIPPPPGMGHTCPTGWNCAL